MEVIPHRELRNNSAEVLRRVSHGEVIGVTNNGELAAIISPPGVSAWENARQAGRVREAAAPREPGFFSRLPRVKSPLTTADIIEDLRSDR